MAFVAPNTSISSDSEHRYFEFRALKTNSTNLLFPWAGCEQRAAGESCEDQLWNGIFASAIPFTLCIKRQVIKRDSNVSAQRMGKKYEMRRRFIFLFSLDWMHPQQKEKEIDSRFVPLCVIAKCLPELWTALINDRDVKAVKQWKERQSVEQIIWVNQKCNSSSCAAHRRSSADNLVDGEWRRRRREPMRNSEQQLSAFKKFWIVWFYVSMLSCISEVKNLSKASTIRWKLENKSTHHQKKKARGKLNGILLHRKKTETWRM